MRSVRRGFTMAVLGKSGAWCFLAVTVNVAVAVWLIVSCVFVGPPKVHYGYATVRPGAHMFWLMYHAEQQGDYTSFPLIMWLQGGPGISGVGFGNFEEFGPVDTGGRRRRGAWTKKTNVLFVDSPVGTGYSYISDSSNFSTNNEQIAEDLVNAVKIIFSLYPDMGKMEFYVFAESYGGKMAADFALALNEAIVKGEVKTDFRGVALGNPWISPIDSISEWGGLLYQMGYVDREGLQRVDAAAQRTREAADEGRWDDAVDEWSNMEDVVMDQTYEINFRNILARNDNSFTLNDSSPFNFSSIPSRLQGLFERHVLSSYLTSHGERHPLKDVMDDRWARQFEIPAEVKWGSQSAEVFTALASDLMKPVKNSVARLLNDTSLHVAIFTGHLDLMCNTLGTYQWIENMDWTDKPEFLATETEPIHIAGYPLPSAFVKESGRLSVYTILRSGRRVATDVPETALKMIDLIIASSQPLESKKNESDGGIRPGYTVLDGSV